MDDRQIVEHIDELISEEHRLERAGTSGSLTDDDRAALSRIEVQLDQCWDQLRQRRARRSAGLDPDDAVVRPPDVVEGYQQ
jgi:hypothetical protein